ncbi:hypothetical protein ACMSES_22420, partial [Bacteroides faecis]|uniref:hypothetical protein n=1 Tax=Bacteroides faecis TaxID=674529 RepID=UPI0039C175BB
HSFYIKKMCAKLRKAGKGLITFAKSMLIGLFINRYKWKIATYLPNESEKSIISKRKYSRTVKRKKKVVPTF